MFIHIGNGDVIRTRDIITIIDYKLVSSSIIMEEMIDNILAQGKSIGKTSHAKSVIITDDHIYFSSLSIPTLQKRSSIRAMVENIDELQLNEDND